MANQTMSADAAGCTVEILEDGSAGSLDFHVTHAEVHSVRLTLGRHALERLRDALDRDLRQHPPAGREPSRTA